MADGVADGKTLQTVAPQQDGEQVVGHHVLDDGGDVLQQLVEIQRFGGDARHFQQEVEQLDALAEADRGLAGLVIEVCT